MKGFFCIEIENDELEALIIAADLEIFSDVFDKDATALCLFVGALHQRIHT